MKRVLLAYFSGAGATARVAALMAAALREHCTVTLASLDEAAAWDLAAYDGLILGTPVYHAAPAALVLDFVAGLPRQTRPLPVFVYNTRATWSCNTNRILARRLAARNLPTVLDRDYRSPASDGALIVPFVRRFFEFERRLEEKIRADCQHFIALLEAGQPRAYLPRFRLSSVLNAPNKLAGQLITFPIHLHRARCVRCGACSRACPHAAWAQDGEGYPLFQRQRCENCYRCIHHCPQQALSLSKRRPVEKQLYR